MTCEQFREAACRFMETTPSERVAFLVHDQFCPICSDWLTKTTEPPKDDAEAETINLLSAAIALSDFAKRRSDPEL